MTNEPGMPEPLVIFTDLDGTLLDNMTYSFEKALPALGLLKRKNIPLVICSSKTRREIEHYRKKLENSHPFISENGGGIFIPKGYFSFSAAEFTSGIETPEIYEVIRLGAEYTDLRKVVNALRSEGFDIKGFGDMSAEEIAVVTGLDIFEAEMAKERDFDEPFIAGGGNGEKIAAMLNSIKEKGFNYTQGRFYHILGNSDKGKAVSILIELYRKEAGEIMSAALGDSPNDLPMLEKVDHPVVVKKPDGSYDPRINIPKLIRADGVGPEGWNKAVLELIS